MTSSFHIRPARISDAGVIAALIAELAAYEKLAHEALATAADLEKTLFGPRAYAEALLAEVNGEPAGFCLFFHNYSTFLGKPGIYIEDVFVRDAYRGHGIGKAFFSEVARLARERDCGRIEWWVLDWNAPAIDFYKKMHATPMDEWTVFRLTQDQFSSL